MDIPTKQLKNGFTLPVYGLGTWTIGGGRERDTTNDGKAVEAIQQALHHGIMHIDTAEMYGAGHTEELIGSAMKDFSREKVILSSKVQPDHLAYDDVLRALEGSLHRLGTDYLDLYLIHAPNPNIPLEETMKALDRLMDEKLVRNIGVSNFSKELLLQAQSLAQHPVVCNQVHYNLQMREAEETGLLQYCQEYDVLLTAYRPVERGVLTKGGNTVLDAIAGKYHKTQAQVALNWLISQKNVVVIAKTSSTQHLEENLGSFGWNLSNEDITALQNVSSF